MIRLALLLSLFVLPALAQTSPMLDAIRKRDWGAARLLTGSPLGVKLVDFIRLLLPEQARAAEILDFLQAHPDWPDRQILERRYAESLRREGDEQNVARLCAAHAPADATALARCAEAFAVTNAPGRADAAARAAWVTGIVQPEEESSFLARWATHITAADQISRFAHIIGNEAAAERQLSRLPPDSQRLGEARLAFRRLDPAALAALANVPAALRGDPFLLLDQARYLRRSHSEAAASALWKGDLGAAERAVAPAQRSGFWMERDELARLLMAEGSAADAYAIAQDDGLPDKEAQESRFLAGWCALEGLHDKSAATPHFLALQGMTRSAIGQSRAAYWLGRAAADPAGAQASFALAARWPLTFYGQAAALAAGETRAALQARITGLRDPALPRDAASGVQATELFKAAQLLIGWQDPRRAADFFLRLIELPGTAAERQVVAETALAEGLPDVAVMAARAIGKEGGALPVSGWPRPVSVPNAGAAPALLLAVMRQESGFDNRITSGAGAQGLMQLMPGTARDVARSNHVPAGPLTDPDINTRLGDLYLEALLHRFHGVEAYTAAAYNAGPHRVQEWLDVGWPGGSGENALIDWIESIPFAETRTYVQRVLENETIYGAQTGK